MTNEDRFAVAIPKCYFCGEDKNQIIMTRLLTEKNAKRVKEMHGKVVDKEPCDKCKEYMRRGVILIEVKEDDPNYRVGGFAVIKDEGIQRIFPAEQAKQLIKMRAGFINEELWKQRGLKKGE